jgi:hypothetical protein
MNRRGRSNRRSVPRQNRRRKARIRIICAAGSPREAPRACSPDLPSEWNIPAGARKNPRGTLTRANRARAREAPEPHRTMPVRAARHLRRIRHHRRRGERVPPWKIRNPTNMSRKPADSIRIRGIDRGGRESGRYARASRGAEPRHGIGPSRSHPCVR